MLIRFPFFIQQFFHACGREPFYCFGVLSPSLCGEKFSVAVKYKKKTQNFDKLYDKLLYNKYGISKYRFFGKAGFIWQS